MGIVMKVLNRQYHRDQDRNQGREQGFTLIELVITIAIMAIIAAMAAPSMQKQIRQAKTKDAANIIEAALKDAKSQALITQKNIKVVLTNTSTAKNLKLFNVGDNTSTATPQQTFNLDKSIILTANPSTLTAVSFTANKKAYQGDTGTGTLMGQDSNGAAMTTGFSVCLGTATQKYSVNVDANGNVSTQENGVCP